MRDIKDILKPISVTRPMMEKYNPNIEHTDDSFDDFNKERMALKANILYVHGFGSSGDSGTASTIGKFLPNCRVIAPDLPLDPNEALNLLKRIIDNENIDFIVGTSMGGMFAQQLRGVPKVIVNPAFHVSRSMRSKIGINPFFKKRRDGATQFEVTEELCDLYETMELSQFEGIDEKENALTYGLFGIDDKVVNCEEEYLSHYNNVMWFEGEHRLSENVILNYVVEAILQLAKLI